MREIIRDSSDFRINSWVGCERKFLVSLDDVELLDGLFHTMACEPAGACQLGEEVAKSCYCIVG